MWEYNSSLKDDELMHRSHKYISKHKGKSGKWIYVYKNQVSNATKNAAAVRGAANEFDDEQFRRERVKNGDVSRKTFRKIDKYEAAIDFKEKVSKVAATKKAANRIRDISGKKVKNFSTNTRKVGKRILALQVAKAFEKEGNIRASIKNGASRKDMKQLERSAAKVNFKNAVKRAAKKKKHK